MPLVPTVNTPSVAPQQGLPDVREQSPYHLDTHATRPGQELASLGAGMLRFGDDMLEEATRQQIGVNEAAAKEYDAKLNGAVNTILYHPDSGYTQMKGKDAVDAYDTTVKALNDAPRTLQKT